MRTAAGLHSALRNYENEYERQKKKKKKKKTMEKKEETCSLSLLTVRPPCIIYKIALIFDLSFSHAEAGCMYIFFRKTDYFRITKVY